VFDRPGIVISGEKATGNVSGYLNIQFKLSSFSTQPQGKLRTLLSQFHNIAYMDPWLGTPFVDTWRNLLINRTLPSQKPAINTVNQTNLNNFIRPQNRHCFYKNKNHIPKHKIPRHCTPPKNRSTTHFLELTRNRSLPMKWKVPEPLEKTINLGFF